jgi:hypothetical protein
MPIVDMHYSNVIFSEVFKKLISPFNNELGTSTRTSLQRFKVSIREKVGRIFSFEILLISWYIDA